MVKQINSTKVATIILLLAISLCLVGLAGCQPATLETPSPAAAIDIPTVRGTAAPTETPLPTATQTANIATFTPQPTNTPRPSLTPFPTQTPTPSPWLIDRSTPFFFFQTLGGLLVGHTDGQLQAIPRRWLLSNGQPWSPDGTRFIFMREIASRYEIFIADLQTGDVQLLDFIHYPIVFWSPDGRYLLFPEEGDGSEGRIMLYDFETDEQKTLSTFPRIHQNHYYYLAGWSPDSRKVAYVAEIEGQYDLFVVDVETLSIQQLTDDPQTEVHVAWSPVESQLLIATSTNQSPFRHPPYIARNLYLMNENGERQWLVEFEELNQISWSPDGRQIAVSNVNRLCILTIDNLSQTCPLEEVFPSDEFAAAFRDRPTWSADGQWLAFQVIRLHVQTCHQSYFLNLLTKELIQLEVDGCLSTEIQWSPAVP